MITFTYKPIDMSTEQSIAAIKKAYPETNASDWRRRIKHDSRATGGSVRVFENVKTGQFCTVYCLDYSDTVVKEGNLMPKTDPELMKRLISAGNKIRHCGDYCQMFWNPTDMTVWMSMGDGDCPMEDEGPDYDGKGMTSYDELKSMLLEAGAKTVLIEAEHSPSWDDALEEESNDEDNGWGKENDASIHSKWWYYYHVSAVKGIALDWT